MEHYLAKENGQTRRLNQVAQTRSEQGIAFPLARITTCGRLTIEVFQTVRQGAKDHGEAVYGPPDAALLAKKGTSTAFTLLALLVSQPGYFATKDWLSEKLGHLADIGEEEDGLESLGLKRVDNVVSRLRFLLFPAQPNEPPEATLVRRRLVEYQRASGESGPGYRLAGLPLLWLDVAEIEVSIKRARRLEQFGEDGLAEWQTAYDLAMGGRFLPGEVYSDWAEWRRRTIETHLWDCVQVLWHRFVEQGAAGEAEALRVLREYWQRHVTNEDALRPLLELLGKRECFGEAQASYEQLCAALDLEGKRPDHRTRDIIDFQQTVQIKRTQTNGDRNIQPLSSYLPKANDEWRSDTGQRENTEILFLVKRQESIQTLVSGIQVMKESRRRLLQQMVSLAGGTLLAPQTLFERALSKQFAKEVRNPPQIDDATLAHLETITRSHWHLFLRAASKGDLLNSFWGHFQTLLQLLGYPSSGAMRNRLYSLAGESAQMIGEILFDMQDYPHAQIYYQFSIYAAKEAGNNALRAVGLGRMSFLPIYRDEPLQACPLLEEAKQLLMYVPRPLIHSWLAVVEAEVMAHLHDEVACEKALEQARANYHHKASEEDLLWTRLNDATIPGYQGACYLQLHLPQQALSSLQETLTFIPAYSPRHQSLIVTDMAAAFLQMDEIKETCRLLHQVLEVTTQTKSLLILTRMQQVRKNLEYWKDTSYVQQLDKSVAEALPSITV